MICDESDESEDSDMFRGREKEDDCVPIESRAGFCVVLLLLGNITGDPSAFDGEEVMAKSK